MALYPKENSVKVTLLFWISYLVPVFRAGSGHIFSGPGRVSGLWFWPGSGTMPWNRLGTPRKFKIRIRKMKNSASQLGQWPKIIIKKPQFVIFEMLILDGTLERAKKLYMDFSKITVFPMSFFPLCCKLVVAGYGRVLTMNFSSPDSEFLLDSLKLLGFSGFLFSETFKALCRGGAPLVTLVVICNFFSRKMELILQSPRFGSRHISGTHWAYYFFSAPSNRSSQDWFVLVQAILAQAGGWKTMSAWGSARG